MTPGRHIASGLAIFVIGSCAAVAQISPASYDDEGNDNPRGNVHLGMPIAIPLNPTAQAVHLGFGLTVGGGYNFNRRNAVITEFVYNDLFPTNEALAQLRTALGDTTVNASASFMTFGEDYRFELRGKKLGTYFMGGGGLYYRHTSLSHTVTTGSSVTCTPEWEFWGFTCTGGTVTSNQTLGSWAATTGGVNGGIGFTVRVGEPPYRFYVESRYHYAPYSRVDLQLINISFGIRY
jgi:Outer membrane protein beta-barrel domain